MPVTAMKGGACDDLAKPVPFEELEAGSERIMAQARTQAGSLRKPLAGHVRRAGEILLGAATAASGADAPDRS